MTMIYFDSNLLMFVLWIDGITGKRECLGKSLAINTFFLFVAALVKSFTFSRVAGEELPTLDPINGFTLGYQGFSAVVESRGENPLPEF